MNGPGFAPGIPSCTQSGHQSVGKDTGTGLERGNHCLRHIGIGKKIARSRAIQSKRLPPDAKNTSARMNSRRTHPIQNQQLAVFDMRTAPCRPLQGRCRIQPACQSVQQKRA